MDVTLIVPVTAMPYAEARFEEFPATTTSATHATVRSPFTSGMYICPSVVADVCTIFMRGTNPSCTACWVREKAPEINACDATTVATAAITTIGSTNQPGT